MQKGGDCDQKQSGQQGFVKVPSVIAPSSTGLQIPERADKICHFREGKKIPECLLKTRSDIRIRLPDGESVRMQLEPMFSKRRLAGKSCGASLAAVYLPYVVLGILSSCTDSINLLTDSNA